VRGRLCAFVDLRPCRSFYGERKRLKLEAFVETERMRKGVESPLGRILLDDYRLATIAIDEGE
jgi:hypothetical protein